MATCFAKGLAIFAAKSVRELMRFSIASNNSKRVIDAVLADSAKPKVSFFKKLIQKIKG